MKTATNPLCMYVSCVLSGMQLQLQRTNSKFSHLVLIRNKNINFMKNIPFVIVMLFCHVGNIGILKGHSYLIKRFL